MPAPFDSSRLHVRPFIWGVIALLGALLIAWLLWSAGAERRAVASLPEQQRREVFEREYGVLQEICGRGPREDALQRRCRVQAEFVLEFPECDATCRSLAESHLPHAAR